MYGFLRQPKWLAAHVLVLVLLTTFVGAGAWQYSRHQERQDRNADVRARSDQAPLVAQDLAALDADQHEFREFTSDGTWRTADLVRIRNRSQNGSSGCHVALPLDVPGATDALVVVGWLPEIACGDEATPDAVTVPPSSEIRGRLRATQTRGALGPRDAADGRLTSLARADVERIDQQVEGALASMYVELIEASPAIDGPVVLDAPPTDSGPHFAYAVQWALFTLVGLIGYPLVLRRQAQRGHLEALD